MKKIFTSILFVLVGCLSYAQTPSLKWATAIGDSPSLRIIDVEIDAAGNHVVAGHFDATQDIDPGTGIHTITPNGTENDILVAKYDSNGNFLWAKTYGGTDVDECAGLKIDATGNVIVTAYVKGIVDLDPDAGVFSVDGGTFGGTSLIKLSPTGNFLWGYCTESVGGLSAPRSIELDNAGNIYVLGSNSNSDFEFGTGVTIFTKSVFLAKFSPSGAFKWVKGTNDIGYPNVVKYHSGTNTLLVGCYAPFGSRILDFSSTTPTTLPGTGGHIHGCVIKMDTSAAYVNHLVIENNDVEFEIKDIAVTNTTMQVIGDFFGTADFDPSSGTSIITGGNPSLYEMDGFVAQYDLNFNHQWSNHFDCTNDMNTNAVVTDGNKNVYVCLNTYYSVDTDPGTGTANYSNGMFIVQLDSTGTYKWTGFNNNNNLATCKLVYDAVKNSLHAAGYGFYTTTDFDPTSTVYDLTTALSGFMFEWGYCTAFGDVDVLLGTNTLICTETGVSSYQWVDCSNGTMVAGATSSSFSPTVNSLYSVMVSGAGCTAQSDCYTFTLGINEYELLAAQVYPNPANSFITIEGSNEIDLTNFHYTLFDINGKLLLQGFLTQNKTIDISTIPNGMYTIRLNNNQLTGHYKFIKN